MNAVFPAGHEPPPHPVARVRGCRLETRLPRAAEKRGPGRPGARAELRVRRAGRGGEGKSRGRQTSPESGLFFLEAVFLSAVRFPRPFSLLEDLHWEKRVPLRSPLPTCR